MPRSSPRRPAFLSTWRASRWRKKPHPPHRHRRQPARRANRDPGSLSAGGSDIERAEPRRCLRPFVQCGGGDGAIVVRGGGVQMHTPYRPLASAGLRQEWRTRRLRPVFAWARQAWLAFHGLRTSGRRRSISVTRIGPVAMSSRRDGLAACRRGFPLCPVFRGKWVGDSSLRC